MANILITGSNGQLGSEFRALAPQHPTHQFTFTDIAELDICNTEAVNDAVITNKIDFIINCAAYTAVDKAESDDAICTRINKEALGVLGRAATAHHAAVIHISTDYVYSGCQYTPYIETDPIAPQSVYGRTKIEGEQLLIKSCPQSIILRTSWLYSIYGNNFVKSMIKLGTEREKLSVVFDQIGSPTWANDLASTILAIINYTIAHKELKAGIYNYSNEGVCSWYDFTCHIHDLCGITSCTVSPILTTQYPTPATRPHYSVMNKGKIKEQFGIEIPYWVESLKKCISKLPH